jgi:hypothetical protein
VTQAVSRQPFSAEERVRARVNPCRIRVGQSGAGTVFSPRTSVSPCQYHSTVVLHTRISPGRLTIGPLLATVQSHSLTPTT